MPLTLLIRATDSSPARELTFDAPRVVVGRGESSDLRLPDASVSHRHASLRQRGSDYIVLDEGSTNGTFVGPVRLSPGAPRVIVSGDTLRVGRIWLEARVTMNPPSPQGTLATKEIALGLVADALAAQGEAAAPTVRIDAGPDAGKSLTLAEFHHPYVVGRVATADLVLDDVDASRRHVSITRKGDQIWVQDLGSKNGSRLGETELGNGIDSVWPADEPLHVAANTFSYIDPVREALRELDRVPDEPLAAADIPPAPQPATAQSQNSAPKVSAAKSFPQRQASSGGWSLSDLLVALLALTVLTVSALGLYWTLGSR